MASKKKPVVLAVVSAFDAAKWDAVDASAAIGELRHFARLLSKSGLEDVCKRIRQNFDIIRVEVAPIGGKNGVNLEKLRMVVNFLKNVADDLSKKTYRKNLITRHRSRLYC